MALGLIMRDIEQVHETETLYEPFECGDIIFAESYPENCPDCKIAMRNRRTPIE